MPKTNELSKSVKNSSAITPLFADETAIVLTKESNGNQIKAYFEGILKLSNSDESFPINLNNVWALVYSRRDKAIATLKKEFIEGIDYKVSPQKVENPLGGRPTEIYYLSIPCLEYFIARKVRPVFEVYRQVFHKVVTGKKEVIYTESEIKKLLTEADRLVSENINKSNRLEDLNKHLKSNFDAIKQLYQDELIYKCNIVAYLYSKGLYQEWEAHYNSLK